MSIVMTSLAPPPGRIRWRWPLPVGFLANARSRQLHEELYREMPTYLADLTEPEVGPVRCDLLVLPYSTEEALVALDRASPRPDATCAMLLTDDPNEPEIDRIAELAQELSAWGVVGVGLSDPSRRAEWFQLLITNLSHDVHLGEAFVEASREVVPNGLWWQEVEGFFHHARLSESLGSLIQRMTVSARDEEVQIPLETAMELGVPSIASAGDIAARINPGDLSFIHEHAGATHGARVSRAAQHVINDVERRQADARFILATVQDSGSNKTLRSGFRTGGRHDIAVWIGRKDREALAGNVAFPDEELPPDANGHRLTVVFSEPELLPEPQVETIELPTLGRSDTARFSLEVPKDAEWVEARLSVLHRGRILQTALLRGPVLRDEEIERGRPGKAIEILIEAVLRPGFTDLDDRQRFDAAVILNHSSEGRAVATLFGRRKVAMLPYAAAEQASTAIGDVFFEAEKDNAFGRELGSEESLSYLRTLAGKGTLLYDAIGKGIEDVHGGRARKVPYIQIVSANPSSFLPVELIYDLPTPSREATLCANGVQALEDGRCDERFHTEDELGHLEVVCPSGFWGLTKVIERHAVNPSRLAEDPKTRGVDFFAVTNPIGDRKTLGAVAPLLFAASDHVNDVDPEELTRVTHALTSLTREGLIPVETWKAWVKRVEGDEPPMLLLLSHTANDSGGAALEINKESARQRALVEDINEHYVNLNPERVGPVVLLLGCDTGVVSSGDFQSFVAQFKEKGASLVVGTIAPILGRHASRIAEVLVEELQTMAIGNDHADCGEPFGAVMRQIRRNLLAKGILVSLAITSYGDVDWRLALA